MKLKQNVSVEKLKNGISIIGEYIPSFHSLIFGFYVKIGSDYENEKLNGISHFTEHLIFKGTKKRNASEISRLIEQYGGMVNAYTARDHTSFYFHSIPDNFEKIFNIFSEMLFQSSIPKSEFEKEKNVIIEEIKAAQDDPEDLAFENLNRIIFAGSPLSQTILGEEKVIKSISREDVLDFIYKNYIEKNSFYSYVGPLSFSKIKRIVEKTDCLKGETKESNNNLKIKENYGKKIYVYKKSLQQFHVAIGVKTSDYYSEERYPLALLSAIVGVGMSSRLFKKLREEKGLVYNVYSFTDLFKSAGMSGIYFACSPENYRKTMDSIKDEFEKIQKNGIEHYELLKVKNQILTNIVMGYDSLSGRMGFNSKSFLYKKRMISMENIIRKYNRVNTDDIKVIARKYFNFEKFNISIVGNLKDFKI